jgi:hypothetical protein
MSDLDAEKLESAKERLERMKRLVEPYVRKPSVRRAPTRNNWQSSDEAESRGKPPQQIVRR